MSIQIALVGNPNCGKTTLFNRLTGANQFVGNWPGVTVEKKEGILIGRKEVTVVDLPGIYSLSPYTPEEVVARDFLMNGRPDVILNLVDGGGLERSLYLTTQLMETGLPLVLAVNMVDRMRAKGDTLDIGRLSHLLGYPVVGISALRGEGVARAAEMAVETATAQPAGPSPCRFDPGIEAVLARLEQTAPVALPAGQRRWYAVKLFERDGRQLKEAPLSPDMRAAADGWIRPLETERQEDSESILADARYRWIEGLLHGGYHRGGRDKPTLSERIDRVATGRITAFPFFALVMLVIYLLSVSVVGGGAAGWIREGAFGEGWYLFGVGRVEYQAAADRYALAAAKADAFTRAAAEAGLNPAEATGLTAICRQYDAAGRLTVEVPVTYAAYLAAVAEQPPDPAQYGCWVPGISALAAQGLTVIGCAEWLTDLLLNGILTGVGAVLSFLPQLFLLFFCLAFLEGCGYMARIAFILDRLLRKFGLSGKSFIPLLLGTGCSVPGILASRTIESEAERRMTVITTSFLPCSAKLPVIALLAGSLFDRAWWIAPSAYFAGLAAVLLSGRILRGTALFAGEPAPFILELPDYSLPTAGSLLCSLRERVGAFVKKAGTVILLASICTWFASNYGFAAGGFGRVGVEDSLLAAAGRGLAPLFGPLGWGDWRAAVAALSGLLAKENIVSTLGVLSGGVETAGRIPLFSQAGGYSFLLFNLLCAPCVAAMGAIRREMHSFRWTAFAIGYQCVFAYLSALTVYQLWSMVVSGRVTSGTVAAVLVIVLVLYLLRQPATSGRLRRSPA